MLSWKTTRVICTVLLLLPIVHLAYLVSRETLATLNPSPDVWAEELSAYAKADSASRLPKHPLVIVGGRRVKLWQNLEEIIETPVLMRGLGDAIIEDIIYNYNALIGFYEPAAVVILPGNSEFHIRDSKTAGELLDAIKDLAAVHSAKDDTSLLYIFAPIKTPLYPRDYSEIDEAGILLDDWAKTNDRVRVLDSNSLLTNEDGLPRARYFLSDGVNLNDLGYLRLAMLLQSSLSEVSIPDPTRGGP